MRKTKNLIAVLLLAIPSFAPAADNKETALQPTASQTAQQESPAKPSATAKILDYATGLVGSAYKFGGKSPETGFDCSGYVGYVFKQAGGLSLPRTAVSISQVGEKITRSDLKPGDLVFFNTLRRTISHVGIYLGDNHFVHASSSRSGVVEISDLRDRYWSNKFSAARRLDVTQSADAAAPAPQAIDSLTPLK